MTWEFEGEARDLRNTITCIRNQDAVDNGDLQRLLDALLPAAMTGTVYNHHRADLPDWCDALICGAVTYGGTVADGTRCSKGPHNEDRHQERDPNTGLLLAEWSSVTPDDDVERLWPDGHIGPRLPADRMRRLRESRD